MSQLSQQFCKSDVVELKHRLWGDDVELLDYKTKSYSDKKLGFMSDLYSLEVEVRDTKTNQLKSKKFFIKKKLNDAMQKKSDNLGLFQKENIVYTKIIPLLQDNFLGEHWNPKCYMTTEDCLIFEDLRDKGCSLRDKFFTPEEMMAVLTSLANMHAASLIAEKKLGRTIIDAFHSTVYPHFLYSDAYKQWVEAGVNLSEMLAIKEGLSAEKVRNICRHLTEGQVPQTNKRNVFCHGDLWSNNIMFNSDSPPKAVLVDFQVVRYGSLASDMLMVMYLCGTREFRNKYESQMMKHYYNTLCEILKKNGHDDLLPSWSEVAHDIKKERLSMAILALLYFPICMLDGTECASVYGEGDKTKSLIFDDRSEIVLDIMKQNKNYNDRIIETLHEMYELGTAMGVTDYSIE